MEHEPRARTREPKDWVDWHRDYDDPESRLSQRLHVVQRQIAAEVERRPGNVRMISMCAGQGRDVVGALREHPRRDDVDALLIELDPRNVAYAQASIDEAGLRRVRIARGDAALTDSYADAVPADIVLACGIFGNISDDDIRRTVAHLPMLCAPAATVIWTRGYGRDGEAPNRIRGWFAESGFEEASFEGSTELRYSVGAHRLVAPPAPFAAGVRLFEFLRLRGD